MKTLFTLLLTFIISLSLMGQHEIKDLQKPHVKKQHKSFNALENRLSRNPESAPRHLLKQSRILPISSLKAENADKQKMDSLLYEELDLMSLQLELVAKEIFTYDGKGNMTQYVRYEFDSITQMMVPTKKEDLTFDVNGNITLYVFYEWDQVSGQWVNSLKWEDQFDGNGKLILEIYSIWDEVSAQWVNAMKYEMTYDGQGNITTEVGSYWDEDGSQWVLWWKDEYSYTDGKLTTYLELSWDDMAEVWVEWYKTESTYDGSGNLTLEVTQEWDFLGNEWINMYKWEYTYDASGNMLTEVEIYWDEDLSQWVNDVKYEYSHDEHGNMTEEVELYWDEGQWYNDWKGVWAYDMAYTYEDLYVPYWFLYNIVDMTFYHKPLSMSEYLYYEATWYLYYKTTAYYSPFQSTAVADIEGSMIKLFPNPARDYLTVTWEDKYPRLDLEILDLGGKRVVFRSIDKNETISIEHLSSGMYLYNLSQNRHVIHSGKISVR
ncbi:MAG: hypothetical protein AMS23_04125 [Bacteroides sp. SM1_62]|nr:MAG: hypothetical protein AMS26_11570 [Bacteroides sp. SM23_62]KPL25893.1 MAG: hypothetical protein AMS23_04125 [Bacteroides sp. SM1_62]